MPLSVEERFWSKVDKNGPIQAHMETCCWVWTAAKFAQGYGAFQLKGRAVRAHRLAWELERGAFIKLDVLHVCDNPSCVRLSHLYLGTDRENGRDRSERGQAACGARHGSVTHPGCQPSGDVHYSRRSPERLPRGEEHGRALLQEAAVRQILKEYTGRYGNLIELSKKHGVPRSVVQRIVRRETWKHVTI